MRILTFSVFAALLSAPAFAADLGTYRPGTPYGSTVAAGADVCDNQCAGDAQCRGWNYVKPNPSAAGICEFLSSVSAPISSQISISGESVSAAPYSPRVTTGGTNTVRVGTQSATTENTVRVGQAPRPRRIVRQAPTQRMQTQRTSTPSVENMSLTAQQNRFRQGMTGAPQSAPMAAPQTMPQRMFRPILDAPAQQVRQPQMRQPQIQPVQRHASRRATGPRRALPQEQPVPQFQNPHTQQYAPVPQGLPPMMQRGQSRPPIGQPIQTPSRPLPTTPSQRLAQMTAQTRTQMPAPTSGPVALSPQQAQKSLFGRLNDDVAPTDTLPTAQAVPTRPVTEQPLGDVLAGGR